MNQSPTEAEVMLAAVARAARAEYERRASAELSREVFAELRAGELEALASQVLEQWPGTGAPLRRSRARWVRPGLIGLAAVAASVLAFGLWRAVDSAPARIAKEPETAPVPAAADADEESWLPDAERWMCTDSAFVDTGRVAVEDGDPERAPRLWLEVRPGYGDADATLLNRMDAGPFRGQRLRLQARVEMSDVSGSAGLWLRVDGAGSRTLARGRRARELSGSRAFELQEVTVDVPQAGEEIVFGVHLAGLGRVAIEDVVFDLVSAANGAGSSARAADAPAAAPRAPGALRKRPLRPVP